MTRDVEAKPRSLRARSEPFLHLGSVGRERVRSGLLAVATLDRPLLRQRQTLGGEDACRAPALAFLEAEPVALVGMPTDGGIATIQAMYHASLLQIA